MAREPRLWLSRSWTTRPQRPGEADDAYTFVAHDDFMAKVAADGVLEWADFLGHLYGTPRPEVPPGRDLVLEIDLQGASQVVQRHPEALVVLLLPPSPEVQAERLRRRGDDEQSVARRLAMADQEERAGRALTPFVVVNHEVDQAVDEVVGILDGHRHRPPASATGAPGGA